MFAILKTLEDAKQKSICFASKEDAENFKSFVKTWRTATGAVNGYGSYWVFDNEEILFCANIPNDAAVHLNMKVVCEMAEEISHCSKQKTNKNFEFSLSIGFKNGAAKFWFSLHQ
ncbi:MAG: hypothetical protein HYW88_01605 [Candidatus Sungbacteria bacterium]|nr:hypothetical protein [Candidatus Sungbacteria bacterium]